MSAENSANLDLGRKLNLIEATLNADDDDPQSRRLGQRLTFSRASIDRGYVTIEGNDLWLSLVGDEEKRVLVTDRNVSEIVGLIENVR